MVEIVLETEIHAPAEAVFAAIVDLRGYRRWLGSSAAYAGTTDISTDPVVAGTTYVESGPSGVRHGTVTELRAPSRVSFHQPMTMKPRLLGVIDIDVTYTLDPAPAGVRVGRVVTLVINWPLRLVQPLVVAQFRREGQRTMRALKAFAETPS